MNRVLPVLAIVLLMSSAGAADPLLPQDDAGSGRDAPDSATPEVSVVPGVVYEGFLGGLDTADHYAFAADAGDQLQFRLTTPGCLDILSPSGQSSRSVCYLSSAGREATVGLALEEPGTWFLMVFTFLAEPSAYRFSFALDAEAPSVGRLADAPKDPLQLPAVSPASQDDEHVVVAVVDTGINPYHEFFRAPQLADHPASWLPGYPSEARSLALDFGHASLPAAFDADRSTIWSTLQTSSYTKASDSFETHLYTFPGTRVVGAVSFGEYAPVTEREKPLTPVFDDNGHGTHSAGLAAGADLAEADGNVLVVMVEVGQGTFDEGILWAARQPWIDAISLSIGTLANVPDPRTFLGTRGSEDATREAALSGKPVFVASGNGILPGGQAPVRSATYLSDYTGPWWVTRVGAAEGDTGSAWHSAPVDALTRTQRASPDAISFTGATLAGGTSASAPNLAGHWAHLMLAAHAENLSISRHDALVHLLRAADPPANEPRVAPVEAFAPIRGYGLVEQAEIAEALATLKSGTPTPRPELDVWFAADAAIRAQIWGPGRLSDGPGVP